MSNFVIEQTDFFWESCTKNIEILENKKCGTTRQVVTCSGINCNWKKNTRKSPLNTNINSIPIPQSRYRRQNSFPEYHNRDTDPKF